MKKRKIVLIIIRGFVVFWIVFDVFRFLEGHSLMPVLFALSTLLLISTVFIGSKDKNKTYAIFHIVLLLVSFAAAVALRFYTNSFGSNVYIFFTLVEILNIDDRFMKSFLVVHALVYITMTVFLTMQQGGSLYDFISRIIFYFALLTVLYLLRNLKLEQFKVNKLNQELMLANAKLKNYSLKIEELTVTRERARMAQELHDSLGHSLMALTLNLDFAQKAFETKPEKVKEILEKAHEICKTAVHNLREAVSALREEREIKELDEAINELADNFKFLGNIKINMDISSKLETLNPEIKNCIYKTIREGLTNGIRHGNATNINIVAKINENTVFLQIRDNGKGSSEIVESNGLKGIRNRIEVLGGNVQLSSSPISGFIIEANIPFYKE